MDNAIIETLNFEDLFTDDEINSKDKSILFFSIITKLAFKYHLTWSYYYESDKDCVLLGFNLEEGYKSRISMNYSKNFKNIKLKFYNYNGKEIKAILKYIKKKK